MEAPAVAVNAADPAPAARSGVWRVGWLTPWRCRILFVALLGYGFFSHLSYVRDPNCPLDLSGDEAHYWDWSRNLDLSYYSKGPLVAYFIRASCAIFGDTMWAVRLPALVLGVGTSIVTYALTLRLFRSDRVVLGAVLLNHIVPMFVAGSLLMTIDPPFFFCWALATYLLAGILFNEQEGGGRWAWPVIGAVVGVGFLAKYAMFLWLPTAMLVLWIDGRRGRRELSRRGGWGSAVFVALLFTIPVIVWNARHGWVSLMHVGKQTGTAGGSGLGGAPARVIEFLAGQAAVVGPALVVLMVAAALYARKRRRSDADDPEARRASFLLWVALPFFTLATLVNLRAKAQLNWPAPAYFTLMILVAWYLATRLRSPETWRPWRPWFYPAVAFGLLMMPVAHNFELVYPLIHWVERTITRPWFHKSLSIRQLDPTVKLRGWEELGRHVGMEARNVGNDAFVLCDDYQTCSEMAFYVPGQPKSYYFGSYLRDKTKRHSQYDLWPDRSLDPKQNPTLLGRNAIYVGYLKPELSEAFERVEELPPLDIERRGVKIRTFRVSRCYNFKGISRPEAKKY